MEGFSGHLPCAHTHTHSRHDTTHTQNWTVHLWMPCAVVRACKTHQNSHKQDTTNVKFMYDAQVMAVPVVKCLAQHFTLCTSFFLSRARSLAPFISINCIRPPSHIISFHSLPHWNKICNENSVVCIVLSINSMSKSVKLLWIASNSKKKLFSPSMFGGNYL